MEEGAEERGEEAVSTTNAEEEGDDAWEDWEAEADDGAGEDTTQSLFDGTTLPSVNAALQYDTDKHGFNLRELRSKVRRRLLTASACEHSWRTCCAQAKAVLFCK